MRTSRTRGNSHWRPWKPVWKVRTWRPQFGTSTASRCGTRSSCAAPGCWTRHTRRSTPVLSTLGEKRSSRRALPPPPGTPGRTGECWCRRRLCRWTPTVSSRSCCAACWSRRTGSCPLFCSCPWFFAFGSWCAGWRDAVGGTGRPICRMCRVWTWRTRRRWPPEDPGANPKCWNSCDNHY